MNMEKNTYKRYADARAPRSPILRDCLFAFVVGGLICTVGQLLRNLYLGPCGLSEEDAGTLTSVTLIALAVVLTGMGFFDRIAKYAGAGTLVPITGFANAVVSPAIDSHAEGLILGVVTMASGIGGSLMTSVLTKIIVSVNWRMAALFSGLLLIAISILFLFVKNQPEELGLVPYGKDSQNSATKTRSCKDDWPGYPGKIILRRPLFYITCLAVTLSCICVNITSTTIVPFFRDAGYSATDASAYNSTLMITLAVAKLVAGWFSDRFGAKLLTFLCLSFTALGQYLLTVVTDPGLSHICVGIFSVSLCMTSITIPLMAVPLFGYQGSLEVNSYILSMPPLATMIATPIVNFARDYFGNYTVAYQAAFVVDLFIILLFIVIFALAKRDKVQYEKAQ